jgi:hypothetical protein
MPLPDNPGSLSVHRAFVIQFGTRTDVARGAFTGRVEHVVSGQVARFDTLDPAGVQRPRAARGRTQLSSGRPVNTGVWDLRTPRGREGTAGIIGKGGTQWIHETSRAGSY